MTVSNKAILSKRLLELSPYIPVEFQRKPRGIEELPRWKATEFRQFILYYGPIVLKNIVDDDLYYEVLLLHVAYRLISTPRHFHSNANTAEELLQVFVENFSKIFGEQSITFNVHCLLHLTQCVKEYGIVSNFSAYEFENFLQFLKIEFGVPLLFCNKLEKNCMMLPLQLLKKRQNLRNREIIKF